MRKVNLNINIRKYNYIVREVNISPLIPLEISVVDRAAMSGHSTEKNLRYYSFVQKDYLENVRQIFNLDSEGKPIVSQGAL